MFRRRINVGSNPRDRALVGREPRHPKICDLDNLPIGGKQKVLRLDITMDNAVLMGKTQTCANLFQVAEGLL